jgi:hypothetical protein
VDGLWEDSCVCSFSFNPSRISNFSTEHAPPFRSIHAEAGRLASSSFWCCNCSVKASPRQRLSFGPTTEHSVLQILHQSRTGQLAMSIPGRNSPDKLLTTLVSIRWRCTPSIRTGLHPCMSTRKCGEAKSENGGVVQLQYVFYKAC